MACAIFDELCKEQARFQQRYAYFAFPENKALRGMSDHMSKQMARDAKTKMVEVTQRMNWHQQGCPQCNERPA
jgi:hypothetical protein